MSDRAGRKTGAIVMAAVFYSQLLASLGPRPAWARVEPINRITKQIHKPNMLVVLDTSGSLTGVPGGSFDYTDEVGVDCDGGLECRGGLSPGTCNVGGKVCNTDAHCTSSTCQSGLADCVTSDDCQPIAGHCGTGQACYVTGDCPALTTGKCGYFTTTTCSSSSACTIRMRCRYGTDVTCATNADCRPGVCSGSTTTCTTSNDCPFATTGGTCAFGTTPTGGCTGVSTCPVRAKVCSNNASLVCTTVNDCGGYCNNKTSATCATNANCANGSGDFCNYSGKTCAAPANSCTLPHMECATLYTDNICSNINPCVPNPNPCTGVAINNCLPGSAGSQCNATGTTTGSRMCRIGLSKCTRDSDCTVADDDCGPATSRLVIAKRVVRNMVNANANILNLGLMTFYQGGYYPYYIVSGSTSSTTSQVSFKEGTLKGAGCYRRTTGVTSSCTINGKTYTLHSSNNAQYLIRGRRGANDKYVNVTYCGYFCDIPGQGTGVFQAAYYDYTNVTGTPSTQVDFPTYQGKVFTQGGVTYRYYDSRPDYYNPYGSGTAPPISVPNCGSSCSASCGGRWDTQLAPFLSTDESPATINAVVAAFNQAMEPADEGGLISYAGTPSGCTLENNVVMDKNHSAYHYMQAVKAADTLTCRQNFVLFITDGEANGPGDSNCTSSVCAATDPGAAGCTCKSVLAAYHMRINLGVKTFVVGFSTDAATGTGRTVNDNIAKAGGTDVGGDGLAPYSFAAANEEQLGLAIQGAIYQAVSGSYSTSPATASQGTSSGSTEQSGTYLLDSRVDFPSWKGHLVAYDLASGSAVLAWDAATRLANMDWRTRRVYTTDASNALVLIDVDPSTGAIRNKANLNTWGLGSSPDEAELIARWMLGDPALKNPAVLGSIINSTPIDVGPPADGTALGAHDFYLSNRLRPSITYVGSDDGMLHGFYTRDVTIAGVAHTGGDEAFAYLPRSMLATVTELYAQGGQVADPDQHLFGLASSPKVKSICVKDCQSIDASSPPVWKTLLVMTEGWGGNGLFMLDITNTATSTPTPIKLMWSSLSHNQAAKFGADLGYTISVPAFTFIPGDGMLDFRVILTSGYPVDDASTTQGRYLMSASARSGDVAVELPISRGSTTCTQDYALLTDVATSRRHLTDTSGVANGGKELLAGYFGDTWGHLWRYTPSNETVEAIASLGCQQPLHFSPTVVQLDADDPSNVAAGQIFLVQVTNSSLDTDTEGYAASQMVIVKENVNSSGRPVTDTTFGTSGQMVLSAANGKLCAVTNAAGTSCTTALPANARPLATPTGVIKPDGTGVIILSNWYAPAATGCGKGATYLQLHDFSGNSVTLKQAVKIADEPVVNPIIVNGSLMVSSSSGPVSIAGSVAIQMVGSTQPLVNTGDPFQISGWSEVQGW
jgi:Neisseria PilC beta-propeller domain